MATKKTRSVPKMETLSEKENSSEISVSEVYDVLEFAKNSISQYYPGIITPDLINSAMKNKNFNPSAVTEIKIEEALADPKNHEKELREYSEMMELISSPFRRILAYMSSQLSYDFSYVPLNVTDPKEYKSVAFKKDEKAFFDYLDRFDFKEQYGNVTKQILRNETCIVATRMDGEKIVLQEMPLHFMKLTAQFDYGFLAAIRMEYFLQPGVDLRLFPKFYTDEFNKVYGMSDREYLGYNPSIAIANRGDSTFATWVDVIPSAGWVLKYDNSIATAVPPLSSIIPEFVNSSFIRSLQKSQYISAATKLLVGQIPMIKDAKTKVSDSIMISPDVLGKFLALIKNAVADAMKVGAVPLEQLQPISFQSEQIYDQYLNTGVNSSGVSTPIIYSGKLKANAIESQLSFQSDSLSMERLYSQYSNHATYFANEFTKKYKFKITFDGNSYFLDKKRKFDNAVQLANLGIVLPQLFANSLGIKPHDMIRQMEMAKTQGFVDSLTPIVMAAQMPGNLSEKGRPQKSDSDLGESGSETRDAGSNLNRGGNV